MRKTYIGAVLAPIAAMTIMTIVPGWAHSAPSTIIVQSDGVTPVTTANPLPVTCPDGTCSGGAGGGGAVFGPTANGSPAANPPVLVGGTADGTATGNVSNLKVDTSGFGYVFVTNAFNLQSTQLLIQADLDALAAAINSAIPAGGSLIGHTDGAGAAAASLVGNPNRTGCRGATAEPTAVTDAQLVDEMCGATGKRIVLPYAIKELAKRGSTGATATATQVSIIASAGGSLKNYITAIQCANSGATTSILTFTDDAATVLINPAGGGGSWTFPVPLSTAAATAFQVTFGSASTSQYCSAQGYTGL